MCGYTFPKRSSGALGDLAGLAEMVLHISLLVWKEKSTPGVGFITSEYETWTGPKLVVALRLPDADCSLTFISVLLRRLFRCNFSTPVALVGGGKNKLAVIFLDSSLSFLLLLESLK